MFYPMLSFVVPAYNEELELPSALVAIRNAAETSGQNYEIIVVDDASTDATADLARNAGAEVISIDRRQIAAARNTGAGAARGEILFFVDADTQIKPEHVSGALDALAAGYSGGSARVTTDHVPRWARVFIKIFCTLYFANNLGAGAFLFTTRKNFGAVSGFDEELFAGEEVYFSLALRKLGRFKILPDPVMTSGRKLRMHSAGHILSRSFTIMLGGKRGVRSRKNLDLWYDGKREAAVPPK
jgi:glycosyltransferase involved in cell wall biosynthesis